MSLENQRPREGAMEKIENYILENQLKQDNRLPSERTMCKMWNYNRATLRSAIKQLTLEGKLYSKTGSGTYIAKEKLIRNLQDTNGFYDTVIKMNRKVSTEVIDIRFCETSKNIGQKMRLPLGHKLLRLTRLRYLDDIPVIYETTHLDAERFEGLENYDFARLSLYHILKEHYKINILEGSEKLGIAYCDEHEARCLWVEQGTPVIYQSGITIDDTNTVLECFKSITNAEYIRFASELRRTQG
jgi:GntR family transcriptional regulator